MVEALVLRDLVVLLAAALLVLVGSHAELAGAMRRLDTQSSLPDGRGLP